MTPEDFVSDLVQWEGEVRYLYLDSEGLVTTGIGNMLPTEASALALPWAHRGGQLLASPDEVRTAYRKVAAMRKGFHASVYSSASDLVIPATKVRELAASRVAQEFIPQIKTLLPDFDSFPSGPQRALVDMVYNEGVGGLARFRHMLQACRAENWILAGDECHSTSREERNAWRRRMFRSGAAAVKATA